MATTKHATIRYHTLDRCFSNYGRKFFIEDLIKACNDAIYDFAGIEDGVKRRQVYDDINFMESEQGWSIPLERFKDGRQVFYRYSDRSFSIRNQGINQSEAEQIKETLAILSRFKGLPHLDWIEEIQIRIEDTFKLNKNLQTVVGFESNPYLRGLNYFTELFNAIQYHQVLNIKYQGYRQETASEMIISPWYLKQYNNRWFLFGYNTAYQALSNLAIDRIISVNDARKVQFIENTQIDFEEYFDDVVGVTVKEDVPTQIIQLKISSEVWPYIESKPLHGSQKLKGVYDSHTEVELNLQINHELIATLFTYLDAIEIEQPESLREQFKMISENIFKKYI